MKNNIVSIVTDRIPQCWLKRSQSTPPGKNDEGRRSDREVKNCVFVHVCAMPQHKFHYDCGKDRLPDLTSDMCRLLSYRSLNGLVRNHRPDGDRDRKWRYGREEKLSSTMDEVKVGKNPRSSCRVVKLSILNILKRYTQRFVNLIALFLVPCFDKREKIIKQKWGEKFQWCALKIKINNNELFS